MFRSIRERYYRYRLDRDPMYVLKMKDASVSCFLKATGVTYQYSDTDAQWKNYYLKDYLTEYVGRRKADEIQCAVAQKYISHLRSFSFIGLAACKIVAERNPYLLKDLSMSGEVRQQLIEYSSSLERFLPPADRVSIRENNR